MVCTCTSLLPPSNFHRSNPNSTPYPHRAQYTFITTRPLRVLLFDGFSAEKGTHGTLDLQEVLAYRQPPSHEPWHFQANKTHVRMMDTERATTLCKWGAQFGIDGFLREEATFEIAYCDFATGVRLIEVTRTSLGFGDDVSDLEDEPRSPPHKGPGGPRRKPTENPYLDSTLWYATSSHPAPCPNHQSD